MVLPPAFGGNAFLRVSVVTIQYGGVRVKEAAMGCFWETLRLSKSDQDLISGTSKVP
jgi:hypothetical protein